ncbi:MAG: trypsin-like peptidase domain-containing protein [Myxococcota bacterium]
MSSIHQFSEDLADLVERAQSAVVEVRGGRRPHSGLVWSEDRIITTSHAVRRDEGIVVVLPSGEERAAVIVGRDYSTDLALLKVAKGGLQPATWLDDASTLRVGNFVVLTGRSGGRIQTALGLISDRSGGWQTSRGGQIDEWIEVDATLAPFMSGGGLLTTAGTFAGLDTAGLTHRGAVVPAATLKRVVPHLEAHGTVTPGYLGVGFQPGTLSGDAARAAGQHDVLLAVSVEPGGPGESADVAVGDALLSIDGQSVTGLRHLIGLLTAKGAGTTVALSLVRAGAVVERSVKLGERPRRPC